jgi:hypothetical protein
VVVWQVEDWMQRYNNPASMIFRHADINEESRRHCPGDSIYNYVIATLADSKAWDGFKDATINGVVFHADKRQVTTTGVLNQRQWASTSSDLTAAAKAEDAKIKVQR